MTGMDEPVDVPRPPDAPQLVVGIGASAGGIAALREFFANVAPDSGHAYVVILHLSPDHESRLAEVLQPVSAIQVAQVTESVRMRPNHVYVVSPNHSLSVSDGMLVASDVTRADQRRASVDLFFRALAEADATRAVSVILSGTGSDGSSGFKRVKQSGGLAIAQDPATAEFPDMPAAAIATGLIDLVLRPADMPSYIRDYGQRLSSMAPLPRPDAESDVTALHEILTLVRLRTDHDFSNYKPATVLRRIARRMNVREMPTLPQYAKYIRDDRGEAAALMKDRPEPDLQRLQVHARR